MNKRIITLIGLLACTQVICAQIGYQVSLLNSATGEPRANESVTVKIEITNSENTVICTEEKNATSNEFGVLSLSVGNEKTFEDVDWTKAPFYVSASIDGFLIGKSQILSVPIAEAAKTLVGLSPDIISGKWKYEGYPVDGKGNPFTITMNFSFNSNSTGTAIRTDTNDNGSSSTTYSFSIEGNTIWLFSNNRVSILRYHNGLLYLYDSVVVYKRI